jgi:hypothetical protein
MTKARFSTNGTTWSTSTFNDYQSPTAWTTVTSNFGNTTIFSISYGNGLWIAGGEIGQTRTSTNGSAWTTVTSNFGSTNIFSIAYGNNLWVAGGGAGQTRTSTNGSTWTTVTSNFGSRTILSISYGNGLWVAVGGYGDMRTSTNGSTWTTVTSNFINNFNGNINSISYGNNLWVAGGGLGQMRTSTNGSTWTTVNSTFGNTVIRSIAYGNGLWVAGGYTGQTRTSTNPNKTENVGGNFVNFENANYLWGALTTNGEVWINNQGINDLGTFNISFSYPQGIIQLSTWDNSFVGVSNTAVYQSINLIIWTTSLAAGANKHITKDDKRLLLQNSGVIRNWSGSSWTTVSTGINDNFVNGAIRNNGGTYEYVIRGNNALYRSTNLTTWTTISIPPASAVNDIIAK